MSKNIFKIYSILFCIIAFISQIVTIDVFYKFQRDIDVYSLFIKSPFRVGCIAVGCLVFFMVEIKLLLVLFKQK